MFKRQVDFDPARPPHKEYGCPSAIMRMSVSGDRGTVSLVVQTGWRPMQWDERPEQPWPSEIAYHSLVPTEGAFKRDDCPHHRTCYLEVIGCGADELFNVLLTHGSDPVWAQLEKRYSNRFYSDES